MKRKVLITGVLLSSLLVGSVSAASSGYNVSIDGRPITLNASPVVQNGVTYVPFKTIFNELGIASAWDSASKKVVAINTKNGDLIYIKANSKVVSVNGKTIRMNAPAKSINGSVYVPIREISSIIGAVIDVKGKNIVIDTPAPDVKPGNPPVVDNSSSANYPKFELGFDFPNNWLDYGPIKAVGDYYYPTAEKKSEPNYNQWDYLGNRDDELNLKFGNAIRIGDKYSRFHFTNANIYDTGIDVIASLRDPDDIYKLLKYSNPQPSLAYDVTKPVADYVHETFKENNFKILLYAQVKYRDYPRIEGVSDSDVYTLEDGSGYLVNKHMLTVEYNYDKGTAIVWYYLVPKDQWHFSIFNTSNLKN